MAPKQQGWLLLLVAVLALFTLYNTLTAAPAPQPPRHVFGTQPVADAALQPAASAELHAVQTSVSGFLRGLDQALQTQTQPPSTPPSTPPHPQRPVGLREQFLQQGAPPEPQQSTSLQLTPFRSQPLSQRQFIQATDRAPASPPSGSPEVQWCKQKQAAHGVKPGSSWGTLSKPDQVSWGTKDCDAHLSGAPRAATRSVSGPSSAPAQGSDVAVVTKWCRKVMWDHDVRPQVNWGSLSGGDQRQWDQLGCDNLITNQGAFVDPDLLPTCPDNANRDLPIIAVCCGTTTRKVNNPQIFKLALFRYLLPSMAHTLDCGFRFIAVVGYDKGDAYYDTLHGKMQVEQWFETHMQEPLRQKGVDMQLHLVKVDNKLKKPGPVFNVITKHAYDVGAEYTYRVNDDTELRTPWARSFVNQLDNMGFPYGAVGPLCQQGNQKILTHDFTHRTHMEIFGGSYYPPQLVDWWMDDWISLVYGSRRTRQGRSVPVVHHTGAHGQRYQVDRSNQKHLKRLLNDGKASIIRYMQQKGLDQSKIKAVETDRFTGHPFNQF